MAITSFKRYEKKYMLTEEQFNNLIPRLLEYMEEDEHCKLGDDYSIYNIYYDTKNSDLIKHSLSKPYYKEKLRLRSYKVPKSPKDKVFLELKKKIGGIVNKRRVVLTLEEAYKFLESGQRPITKDYISEQVINEIEYFLRRNTVYPTAYISYSRMAFFGKEDRDFRVTFDSNILTRRNDLYLEMGSFGEELLKPGSRLMEVKILGAIPLWLASIFSELSIYSTSFSKYGNEYKKYCLNKEYSELKRREKIC